MATLWKTRLSLFRNATKLTAILAGLFLARQAFAQTDPGPRGGAARAGNPVAGLTTNQFDLALS